MKSSRRRVLLVEDDDVDRELIQRHLGSACVLTHAVDIAQAQDAARQQTFDVVLIDYRLPDGMGLELVPEMVARELAVIMLTGEGNQQVAVEAMKEGCHDYLVKGTLTAVAVQRAIEVACRQVELQRELRDRQTELAGFVSIAAHDLRTPVQSIIGMADLLSDVLGPEASADARELTTRILDSATRADRLIGSLLEYARHGRSTRNFAPVELDRVFAEIAQDLSEPLANSDAELNLPSLPVVFGDEVALRQLFQNLVANALKFSRHTQPKIDVTVSDVSGGVEIGVSDNGIGIPADQHQAIFAPFHRLHSDSEYDGSGIGLATCQRIITQHNGRIRIESELGTGSTFFVMLPTDHATHDATGDRTPGSA